MKTYKTVYDKDGELESQAWCQPCGDEKTQVVEVNQVFYCKECILEMLKMFE